MPAAKRRVKARTEGEDLVVPGEVERNWRLLRELRRRLSAARQRGEAFDVAWTEATTVFGTDVAWGRVLKATRPAWARAYNGHDDPDARALTLLYEK